MIFILSGFLLGIAGSWFVIHFGARLGLMDIPTSRSSHNREIPKGAGVGILSAIVMFGLILEIPFFIWVPAMVISATSFWGADRNVLSVSIRLMIQFGCALFFLFFFLMSKQAGVWAWLAWIPVLFFIVGTANFYNFMDGINGIAGITGFIAFSLMGFHVWTSGGDPVYIAWSLVIAFSCLGFLIFNIPIARVFIGDVGSVLLGFVFACLVVFLSEDVTDFLVMAGFMAPFYFDELFTMVIRIRDKDLLTKPHRKHIYQILANEAGIGHCWISVGYGLMQVVIGISVKVAQPAGTVFLLGVYMMYGLAFVIFSVMVRKKFADR
jgi:Fuc2NAc and GlcNAc transferase